MVRNTELVTEYDRYMKMASMYNGLTANITKMETLFLLSLVLKN